MNIPLYPRGFFFARNEIDLPVDVSHFSQQSTVHGSFWFSPETEYAVLEFGRFAFVLLGHAHYVNLDKSVSELADVLELVARAWKGKETRGVEELLYDLAGRYVLFVLGENTAFAYQDAHGMRSVYFNDDASVLTSHERMIADITKAPVGNSRLAELPLALRWSKTRYTGIRAMLPNHRLDMMSASQQRFFPTSANPYVELPVADRVSMVQDLWSEQLRVLASKRTLALSMTGGLDSRISLAMAREVWGSIRAFTYTATPLQDNAWSRSIYKDEVIVRQLLDVVDVHHRFLDRDEAIDFTSSELGIIEKNSAGQHGRWLLKLYREHVSGENVVHLRGNLNETARNYFHQFTDPVTPMNGLRKLLKKQILQRKPSVGDELQHVMDELEEEFETFGIALVDPSYEPLDLYYWEARQARWFSEVFNETDWAFDTAIPFNHRRIIDLALSFTSQERKEGFLFRELINLNAPLLNFYGVNDTENLYEQGRRVKQKQEPAAHIDGPVKKICLYDSTKGLTGELPYLGQLYIPADQIRRGHSSSVSYVVAELSDAVGSVDIRILIDNSYENMRGAQYLELVAMLDDKLVARHDLAFWPEPFTISITDVAPASRLTLRINSLREVPKPSWEMASRTKIRITSRPSTRPGRKILTDNPFAKVEG